MKNSVCQSNSLTHNGRTSTLKMMFGGEISILKYLRKVEMSVQMNMERQPVIQQGNLTIDSVLYSHIGRKEN